MKKPVVGIIAIFCAQFAFIAYCYLDRPLNTALVSPISISGQGPATLEPVHVFNAPERPARTINYSPLVRRPVDPGPAFVHVNRAVKGRPSRLEPSSSLLALQKPVIITYRTEYPVSDRGTRESEDRGPTIKPYKEKRSLASRALPIIKKPYDWLKAVASKLH